MLRCRILGLSLLAAAALGSAGSPDTSSQLRGSAAANGAAAQAKNSSVEELPRHTQCSCNNAETCRCTTSASGAAAESEEQQQVQQAILNRTQELQRLWEAQGGLAGKMVCDCVSGSKQCGCGSVAEHEADPAASEAPAPALLNETQQVMSLWWGGAGYHAGGWGYHPAWGFHPGWGGGCGGGHFAGCRCAWGGCGCGGVHGGGCGWR